MLTRSFLSWPSKVVGRALLSRGLVSWQMVAPGEAGKEAPEGQDAPQPCLEQDIGVPQMWLWCWGDPRALVSVGFLPTAIPEQPGVEDGACREPGCQDSYGLFMGGGDVQPHGTVCGGDAQPQVAVCE